MRRKRYLMLCMLVLLLSVISISLEWVDYNRKMNGSDCFGSLYFSVESNRSEQKLKCFLEEKEQIWYLFLPSYAGIGNVKVFFGGGADRIVFMQGNDSVSQRSGGKLPALEMDTPYEMYFIRRGETVDQGRFVIMHSAILPAMFLETESGTMDMIDADKDYEEPGKIVLYDSDGSVDCADKLQHISGRGNSTWAYPKKSYGIRLKNAADLFQMGSASNWVLLSNVEDNSYIRNRITYDMAIAAGMEGAPESCYIDLYINHEYHGMYQLCEKVEIDQQRIPIANLGLENRRHNKDIEFSTRFSMEDKKGVTLATDPHDISGGYLLERDVMSKYGEETSGFETSTLHDKYTIKSPKYASRAQVDYISSLMSDMEKAVVAEEGVNPDTGINYAEYIDLRSFAQKYIIEELSKNNGGGATSSFFYKPQDSISTKIYGGPVWDYDKAYGRVYGFDATPRNLCYLTQRGEGTVFFWYLSRHPEFQQMVSECYEGFFSDYLQKICDELIDVYASEIYAAEEMDQIRWKQIYGENTSYGQRIDMIRSFLLERKAFLDEVWIGRKELCTVHFVADEYSRDTYMSVVRGECLGALPIGEVGCVSDRVVFDGWYTQDGEPFDGTKPLYEDVTVYSTSHPLTEDD